METKIDLNELRTSAALVATIMDNNNIVWLSEHSSGNKNIKGATRSEKKKQKKTDERAIQANIIFNFNANEEHRFVLNVKIEFLLDACKWCIFHIFLVYFLSFICFIALHPSIESVKFCRQALFHNAYLFLIT